MSAILYSIVVLLCFMHGFKNNGCIKQKSFPRGKSGS
jgi:hypothetical protein